MAHDYRYFPEPDLPPVFVTDEYIQKVKDTLPPLPNELIKKYIEDLGLSKYDAEVLTEDKAFALYYESLTNNTKNYKAAANWMMGAIKSYLNENAITIAEFPLKASQIAAIIELIDEGKISNSIANQKIFPALIEKPNMHPKEIAEKNNWIQESDTSSLEKYIDEAITAFPKKVEEYKKGNKNLLGLFMGQVMKASKGKADPKVANELLRERLD